MKITNFLLAASLGIFAMACNESQFPGYTKTEEGLYYQFHHDVDSGVAPVKGDYVTLDIIYKNQNDSIFMNSMEDNQQLVFPFPGVEAPGDIYSGISLMTPGDSASFVLSADSFFTHTAKQEMPPFITPGEMITLTVMLREVTSAADMQKKQLEAMKMEQEMSMVRAGEEKAIIEEYMTANNLKGVTQPSGLVYIETKKGTGTQAAAGSNVKVNYTGRMMDGKVFDTSLEKVAQESGVYNPQRPYEPFSFTLGQGQVIMGWDEGLTLMKEGGKATLIVPSLLGYGPQGYGPIEANSILIFDVELIDVE